MKVRMMFAVAMLVAGVVTETLADGPAKLAIVKRSAHVYKVIYSGDAAETMLTVKNRFGEVVFSERINSARGFILPLNFARLQPGRYTIELVSGKEKFSETVVIGRNAVNSPFTAHIAQIGDDRYLCSVRTTTELPVTLSVQNENGETWAEHRISQGETAFVVTLKNFSGKPVFILSDAEGHVVTIRK